MIIIVRAHIVTRKKRYKYKAQYLALNNTHYTIIVITGIRRSRAPERHRGSAT